MSLILKTTFTEVFCLWGGSRVLDLHLQYVNLLSLLIFQDLDPSFGVAKVRITPREVNRCCWAGYGGQLVLNVNTLFVQA